MIDQTLCAKIPNQLIIIFIWAVSLLIFKLFWPVDLSLQHPPVPMYILSDLHIYIAGSLKQCFAFCTMVSFQFAIDDALIR